MYSKRDKEPLEKRLIWGPRQEMYSVSLESCHTGKQGRSKDFQDHTAQKPSACTLHKLISVER